MKAKTVLVAAVAGGLGYVLGTRAGHERFEQIKAKASDLAHSPQAHDAAAKVADQVKKNVGRLPDPVADVVSRAADAVADAPTSTPSDTTPGPSAT